MHGMVNRAMECFLRDSYGDAFWSDIVERANLECDTFEAMLQYDDQSIRKVVFMAGKLLEKPYDEILEDFGTYLVSHPNMGRVRRLLRFAGVSFVDFLLSLEDLPDRARLAVDDLSLPRIELDELGGNCFRLRIMSTQGAPIAIGALRAMADDYGALVVIEHEGSAGAWEQIHIALVEGQFSAGRAFRLTMEA